MAIRFSSGFMTTYRPINRNDLIMEEVNKIEKQFSEFKKLCPNSGKHSIELWQIVFEYNDNINSLGIKSDVLKYVRDSFTEMGLTEIKITKEKQFPTYAEFAFVYEDNSGYSVCYCNSSDNLEHCTKIFACF